VYYAARDYFESYRLRARCKLVRIPPSASLQIKSPASAAVSSNRNDALRAAECMPLMGVPGRVRCRSVPDISELQDLLSLCLCLHASRDSPARCRSSSSLSASRGNNEIYRQYTLSANEANKGVY